MTYWRRRFVALVVGLTVLAVIAWAFSGAVDAGRRSPAAAGRGSPGQNAHASGASPGSGLAGASLSATARQVTRSSAPTLDRAAAPGNPAPGSPAQTPQSSAVPRACPPGAVVLSLFPSQDSYGRGQPPEFSVDVVSTLARICAVNVGPRFLGLVITEHGKRIWSSADCVAGQGSLLTGLARGVPAILPLSWDRQTSSPRCTLASREMPPGVFTAAAFDGSLASNPVTFTLSS
jgi:hypothetical protein